MRPARSGAARRFASPCASPGLRGTFDVAPRATGMTLTEDALHLGVYTGTYVVETGDDVLNGHIIGSSLRRDRPERDSPIARAPLTIDTVPPRIIKLSRLTALLSITPSRTSQCKPMTSAAAASPEPPCPLQMTGQTFGGACHRRATRHCHGIPTRLIKRQATIRVNIADAANNSSSVTFSITVNGAAGAITAFTHNAARALQAGEDVVVELQAPTGGQATLDVVDSANQLLAHDIPLRETAPGHYRGTYRIQDTTEAARLRLVGHYTDANNQVSTSEATTPLLILDNTPPVLAILQPTATEHAVSRSWYEAAPLQAQ